MAETKTVAETAWMVEVGGAGVARRRERYGRTMAPIRCDRERWPTVLG